MPDVRSPTLTNEIKEEILQAMSKNTVELRDEIRSLNTKMDNTMSMIQSLENVCRGLDMRLTRVEQANTKMETTISTMKSSHIATESQVNAIKTTIVNINKSIGTEVYEHINRYQRRLNVIVRGVPEGPNTVEFLTSLLNVI